jgi:cell division septation protein DedD
MNSKNIRQFEITLGVMQLVVVLGAILGSLACSFYLGFFSGQSAGFERAIVNTASALPSLPIPGEDPALGPSDDLTSQVYAKLSDDLGSSSDRQQANGAVAPIVDASSSPFLADASAGEVAGTGVAIGGVGAGGQEQARAVQDDFFGDLVPAPATEKGSKPTLGALLAPQGQAAAQPEKHSENVGSELAAKRGSTSSETALSGSEISTRVSKEAGVVKPAAAKEPARSESVAAATRVEKARIENRQQEPVKALAAKATTSRPESMIRKVVPTGWYAQIAAPKRVTEAEAMAEKLKKAGFPVMIENANVRGQEYFRVIVGPEGSRERADRLVAQIRREGVSGGDPFVRMVK